MINDTKANLINLLDTLSTGGFSIGVDFNGNSPQWAHSSYQDEWVNYYLDRRLVLKDPTILHGKENVGHWAWSDLMQIYPDNEVFRACTRFGLSEGNTLSMRLEGVCTIASCAGPKWSRLELKYAQAAVSGLHCLHVPDERRCPVTDQSLAVLKLMCDGKRDKEIADTLGIQLVTVRKRRALALQATECDTPPQCIRLMIKNEWL